jgi:hypothetical protein
MAVWVCHIGSDFSVMRVPLVQRHPENDMTYHDAT